METWLIFSIASIFFARFHNFSLKIAAEKHYDISIINIYSYIIATFIFWIYIIFNYKNIIFDNFIILFFLGLFNALLFFGSMFSRIESMKNIDTVIFFPLYKTIWPIFVTLISLFFFKENLEFKEIIWIVIWFSIPMLLITNSEKKKQKNLFLWIILVLVTVIFTSITCWFSKEVMIKWYDLIFYLFIVSVSWLFISLISYFYFKKKNKTLKTKGIFKFWIISWILHFASFLSFMLALNWNLAIVYTINSFSILIPIILSVIFYKEEMTYKKAFIIFLSIVSMLFFI